MRAALARIAEARAARRRAAIVAGLEAAGVEAAVVGDDVRAQARGLTERWWRDLSLREAGRGGI